MSDPAAGVTGTPPPVPGGMQWSAGNAISFGWQKVTSDFGIVFVYFVGLIAASLIGIVGSVVVHLGARAHDRDVAVLCTFLGVGLQVINLPVSFWIQMGMIRYALKVARGERAEFGVIFSGGPLLTFLGAGILTGLATLVGYAFCILPGVFLKISWCFWPYLVVDRGADVVDSMTRSWRMTEGRRLDLFVFLLLLFLVNCVGLLACGIGVFVTWSLSSVAFAWTYHRFVEMNPQAAAGPES